MPRQSIMPRKFRYKSFPIHSPVINHLTVYCFFVHPITGHVDPERKERFSCTFSLTLSLDRASGERHAPAALTPCSVRYCDVCTVRHEQLLWIARASQLMAKRSVRHDGMLPDVDNWAISCTAWARRFSFDFVHVCCWHVTSCNSRTVGLWEQ
jgi:hypothetical protein